MQGQDSAFVAAFVVLVFVEEWREIGFLRMQHHDAVVGGIADYDGIHGITVGIGGINL